MALLFCVLARAPARARDGEPSHAPAATLRFERAGSTDSPLWLYRSSGPSSQPSASGSPRRVLGRTFVPLCQAPCAFALSPGTYQLGIGAGVSPRYLEVDRTVQLTGTETLVGRVESRTALRVVGASLAGAGLVTMIVGALLGISAATDNAPLDLGSAPRRVGPGVGFTVSMTAGVVALGTGLVLAAVPDVARLHVQR